MAFRISRQRVRVKVDTNLKTGSGSILDAISGGLPKFARGAALQIEVGLFFADQVLDISDITAATCVIKAAAAVGGADAMTQTIGVNAMNKALTDEEWATGEAGKCHFLFTFSSAETADGVFGSPSGEVTHWINFNGLTDDRVLFGFGPYIQTHDAGFIQLGAPPAGQTAVSVAEMEAKLQSFVKKIGDPGDTITLVSPTGVGRAKLAADEAGNLSTGTNPAD